MHECAGFIVPTRSCYCYWGDAPAPSSVSCYAGANGQGSHVCACEPEKKLARCNIKTDTIPARDSICTITKLTKLLWFLIGLSSICYTYSFISSIRCTHGVENEHICLSSDANA